MFHRKQNKKEDLEVNVSDGKNITYDEEIPIEDVDIQTPKNASETESDVSDEPELHLPLNKNNTRRLTTQLSRDIETKRPKSGSGVRPKPLTSKQSDSDSDSDLMVMEPPLRGGPLPGEYDPDKFNDLNVPDDVADLFQYITKYTPQHLNLDYKFKPFVPDYIPAVGDIDAFLKVINPERMLLTGESVKFNDLGLAVLDEPAANQSDSALLHLQLRAVSVTTNKDNKNMIIKKIDNVEKNSKTIDKWIIDISDLHRAKPPPMVKYTNPMPDIDNLMQEWPQPVELLLRKDGFPSHKLQCSLSEYIDLACAIFDVPVYEKKIQSVHLLFSLYIAIKNSQLYNLGNERDANEDMDTIDLNVEHQISNGTTDQLILD